MPVTKVSFLIILEKLFTLFALQHSIRKLFLKTEPQTLKMENFLMFELKGGISNLRLFITL